MRKTLLLILLASTTCAPQTIRADEPAYDYREMEEWGRYADKESGNGFNRARKRPYTGTQTERKSAAAGSSRSTSGFPELQVNQTQVGSFTVPAWVGDGRPFERPTETFVVGPRNDSTAPTPTFGASVSPWWGGGAWSGFGSYGAFASPLSMAYSLPAYGLGYTPYSYGAPFLGGIGYGGIGYGGIGYGGIGYGGIGYGGWGLGGLGLGGMGPGGFGGWGGWAAPGFAAPFVPSAPVGWGYGGWGWYGSPARAALFMGAGGYRPFGSSGPRMGTRVIQSAPSKASGNYYQPSTADPSASGSYYASGGPWSVPVSVPEPQPKDYWGPSGNPFPANNQ